MSRDCPVCRVPLKQVTVKEHLQIDVCQTCRGIWFDKNELTQAHTEGQLPDKLMGRPNLTRDKVICQSCGAHNERSKKICERCQAPLEFMCPVCSEQLEEVPVGNVQIDRCNKCQGVWLDGGELALLFDEYKHKKQAEIRHVRSEGREIAGDLAVWAAVDTLDLLIWRPDIAYRMGDAVVDTVTELPGAIAGGVGAAIDGIGNIPDVAGDLAGGAVDLAGGAAEAAGDFIGNVPEMAGDLAEGAVNLAGGAADVAGDLMGGAIDLVGEVPEMAGAVAEAGASFIEMLFDILGSIFD